MSNHFIELTDSLCRSPAIHQDRQLLQDSLSATSKVLDLAQQANLHPEDDNDLDIDSNATLNTSSREKSAITELTDAAVAVPVLENQNQIQAKGFEVKTDSSMRNAEYESIIPCVSTMLTMY